MAAHPDKAYLSIAGEVEGVAEERLAEARRGTSGPRGGGSDVLCRIVTFGFSKVHFIRMKQ